MQAASIVIRNVKLHSLKIQLEFESRFFITQSKVFDQCGTKLYKDDLKSKRLLQMTIISVWRSNDFNWSSYSLRANKILKNFWFSRFPSACAIWKLMFFETIILLQIRNIVNFKLQVTNDITITTVTKITIYVLYLLE